MQTTIPLRPLPDFHRPTTWLIVEDDTAVRDVVEMMCALWSFEFRAFKDGFQAADYLNNPDPPEPLPDIALLDIRLPGPWGHELGARIRQHPRLKGIFIFLMTSYALSRADEERYLRIARADKLIYKPLPPMDDLLAYITGAQGDR